MKRTLVLVVMVLFAVSGVARATEGRKTAEEAKAMLDKAVSYYQANGKEKALAVFNDPKGAFVDGDLFIFALDMNGTILAHGGKPGLVGKGPNEIRDSDETNFIDAMVKVAKEKGSGTVNYKFENPASLVVEKKASFIQRIDDTIDGTILGCGYFTAYEWQVFPHPASR